VIKKTQKTIDQMEKQQRQLDKVKKEKENEEDKGIVMDEKRKAINLENQKLQKEIEELEKYYHQSTIDVEDEYKVKRKRIRKV
jgi:hypothetical protein